MDRATLNGLYDADYRSIVEAVAPLTGDPQSARDVVDEAVARAWEHATNGHAIMSVGAWTRVVAMNLARDRRRRRRIEERLHRESDLQATDTTDTWNSAIDVRRALADLSPRQRQVTVLHYFQDRSVTEIADQIDVAPGTVKATLFAARRELARSLVCDEFRSSV